MIKGREGKGGEGKEGRGEEQREGWDGVNPQKQILAMRSCMKLTTQF
jgi:hypothetical protein